MLLTSAFSKENSAVSLEEWVLVFKVFTTATRKIRDKSLVWLEMDLPVSRRTPCHRRFTPALTEEVSKEDMLTATLAISLCGLTCALLAAGAGENARQKHQEWMKFNSFQLQMWLYQGKIRQLQPYLNATSRIYKREKRTWKGRYSQGERSAWERKSSRARER